MSFYNLFVTSICSADQQRNSPPKTLTSLSNRERWVDKVPDYLRSGTKDGNQSTFLDSGHYMVSNGELSKDYSPLEVAKAHASERSVPQH